MKPLKLILIIVAVLSLIGAIFLISNQTFSIIDDNNNVVVDTQIFCETNNDCKTDPELPDYSYCEDLSCKFVYPNIYIGDINELR